MTHPWTPRRSGQKKTGGGKKYTITPKLKDDFLNAYAAIVKIEGEFGVKSFTCHSGPKMRFMKE